MKQLAPRAVWLFFLQSIVGFIVLYLIFGFYIGITILSYFIGASGGQSIIGTGIIINVALLIPVFLMSFAWAKLSYKNYKYELREDGFRKESGVIWKKYVTIPYERIQNVDIYRGFFARLLGLSDVHIQTAGNSAVSGRFGMNAEGRLPGITVQEAETIRDELVRRSRGQQQAQTNPQPSVTSQNPPMSSIQSGL